MNACRGALSRLKANRTYGSMMSLRRPFALLDIRQWTRSDARGVERDAVWMAQETEASVVILDTYFINDVEELSDGSAKRYRN